MIILFLYMEHKSALYATSLHRTYNLVTIHDGDSKIVSPCNSSNRNNTS